MERQLSNYELVCYEKNSEVGGTWYENKYPGAACDVPAHCYTYTFEANPHWSSYYAYAPEILQYFKDFRDRYNLQRYIRLEHKVIGARWLEDEGQWEVEVEHQGKVFNDRCNILVNGSGLLNKWKWPDIKGLHDFQGQLLHSASWDSSVELKGKTVAVLGTGSSAIQIIPQAQKVATKLKCFMRSNTWIASPMPRVEVDAHEQLEQEVGKEALTEADAKLQQLNDRVENIEKPSLANGMTKSDVSTAEGRNDETPNPVPAAPLKQDIQQYYYKPHEIKKMAEDPEYLLMYRKKIEFAMNYGFQIFYKDSKASKMVQQYMAAEMARRLNHHPELTKHLIPEWPVGCRRLTPGDGYLEALVQPNTQPIYSDITHIDATGLTTEDGQHHTADVIICATGFDMAWTPHFELRGVDGIRIHDAWSPSPNCYLGLAAPGFPNYWVMNGPRGNLCNGTVIPCFETQLDYVIKAAKKMQSDRICALEVKEDITESLNDYVDTWHAGGVWSGDCKSWYKNNTKGGKIMCWGGSLPTMDNVAEYFRTVENSLRQAIDTASLGIPVTEIAIFKTLAEVDAEALDAIRQDFVVNSAKGEGVLGIRWGASLDDSRTVVVVFDWRRIEDHWAFWQRSEMPTVLACINRWFVPGPPVVHHYRFDPPGMISKDYLRVSIWDRGEVVPVTDILNDVRGQQSSSEVKGAFAVDPGQTTWCCVMEGFGSGDEARTAPIAKKMESHLFKAEYVEASNA
ncbi:hypothetical protein KC363_g8772 [Hortaea werneckii]|nr:hypothetical protein KC363_g8772 [Hortaea werneckii]